MNNYLSWCFDDVLLVPSFSSIKSRKDVNVKQQVCGEDILGIISSNMDSVTGPEMALEMNRLGAKGCLHRFCPIDSNVEMFTKSKAAKPWVSVGLGEKELERAKALSDSGATTFVIDVAHGASMEVVNQAKKIRDFLPKETFLIVGNFATGRAINDFVYHFGMDKLIDGFKVGIGGGSACTTRKVTGCGIPTLGSVIDCIKTNYPIIADGGIRNSGDFAKCLAAGAKAVMIGRLLAGTTESPGKLTMGQEENYPTDFIEHYYLYKLYRGSASASSYEVQNKRAIHRSPEGESYLVDHTGGACKVIQQLEAGLRSSMSYLGANDLQEFKDNAEFISISNAALKENGAHGDT